MPTRRSALIGLAAAAAPLSVWAEDEDRKVENALLALVFGSSVDIPPALRFLTERCRRDVVTGLIFALRFSRYDRAAFLSALTALTGEEGRYDWHDWALWQEAHPEVKSHPAYYVMKRTFLMEKEPDWRPFLRPEFIADGAMDIRFEEVAWGGVHRDTIAPLDFPDLIAAEEATYLRDDDLVFGVEINGDIRAYPLRIMGWHEMFNEVIGGVPVALAYCTLCGAGILLETDVTGREAPFIFSTTGFLYRSNKLMYDRQTESMWNQFTGRPVSGALRGSGIELAQRPVTIEPWGDWKARNPGTRVLSLTTGHDRDYGSGVVYRDYFASPDLMFPTAVDQTRLRQKDYVFGVRQFGAAKAWSLAVFEGGRVLNDQIADTPLVLVGDAAGRTVRAYERQGVVFRKGPDAAVLTGGGQNWRVTEAALVAEDGAVLPRVAGHIAYWFAWDGYLGPKADLVEK